MRRLVSIITILILLSLPIVLSVDSEQSVWNEQHTHRYDGGWHSEAPTEGTYHTVTGSEYYYTVVQTGSNGVKRTYLVGTLDAPESVDPNWPVIGSNPTVLNAPTTATTGTTGTTTTTQTRTGGTTTVPKQFIVRRTGQPPIVVTVTTTGKQATYTSQVPGQPATNAIRIPAGTSPDWSRFNPAQPQVVPTSGGGSRTLTATDGSAYTDRDRDGRQTTIVQNGVTTTRTYESNVKPKDWNPASPGTSEFGRVTTETIRVKGVNGELVHTRTSTGVSTIPPTLQRDEFYRAAIESGITSIDSDSKFTTSGGVTRLDSGNIQLMGTSSQIIVQKGDQVTVYPVQTATVNYGGGNLPNFAPGSRLQVTAENIDGAVNLQTGAIDTTKLSNDQNYQIAITNTDGTTELIRRNKNEQGGDSFVGRSRYNQRTGALQEVSENGVTVTATHTLGKGAEHVNLVALGLENTDAARVRLNQQLINQFGPDAQVFHHSDGKLLNVNGQWYTHTERGEILSCSSLRSSADCDSLTDEELDRLEREVIDPQRKQLGLPSTGALQFAQFLDDFKYYANAYPGLAGFSSIMFPEEFLADWREGVNTVMCDMLHLGGADCWTSQICEIYTDIEQPTGSLIGQTPDGSPRSIAHIEGERSPPIRFEGAGRKQLVDVFGEKVITVAGQQYDLSDQEVDLSGLPAIEAYVYKITLAFSAEASSTINVRFNGEGRNVNWFSQDLQLQAGQVYSRIRSNPIHFISATSYDSVCITFNPGQETLNGKSVNQQCTGISEYDGAATTPLQADGVSDGTGTPSTTDGTSGGPQEGRGI